MSVYFLLLAPTEDHPSMCECSANSEGHSEYRLLCDWVNFVKKVFFLCKGNEHALLMIILYTDTFTVTECY